MTIAAGFKCMDGIVLCADSQETSGSGYKRTVAKLLIKPPKASKLPEDYPGPVAVFTGAGDGTFIDELIEEMWEAANGETSLYDAVTKMKEANRQYHQTIWQLYPCLNSTTELPDADILFAVWCQDGFGLYQFEGVKFREVQQFSSIGCGMDLAGYLCDSRSTTTCIEASIQAAYMLEKVKGRVNGCGGESYIAVMPNHGAAHLLSGTEITALISQLKEFEDYTQEILFAGANLSFEDDNFRAYCNLVVEQIIDTRKQRRVAEEKRKLLMEKMKQHKEARDRAKESGETLP